MNLRRILLASIITIVLLFAGSIAAWRFLGGEAHFRAALLDYLHSHVHPSITIDRLSPHPRYLSLKGVSVEISPTLTLSASSLRLRLSLWALLFGDKNKKGVITQAIIVNPVLTIRPASTDTTISPPVKLPPHPFTRLSALQAVKRIVISDGMVVSAGTSVAIAENLSGLLDLSQPANVTISMRGELAAAPAVQATVIGVADLIAGDAHLTAVVKCDTLAALPMGKLAPDLTIYSGSAKIQVELSVGEKVTVEGTTVIQNVAGEYRQKLRVENAGLTGVINDDRLELNGEARLNGVMLPFKAAVSLLPQLQWEVRLESEEVDLSGLHNESGEALGLRGLAVVQGFASGDWHRFSASLDAKCGNLNLYGQTIRDINLRVGAHDGSFYLTGASAHVLGGALTASGEIYSGNGTTDLSVDYSGRWVVPEALDWVKHKALDVEVSARLKRDDGQWRLPGSGRLRGDNGDILLAGDMFTEGRQLKVLVRLPADSGFVAVNWNWLAHELTLEINAVNPQLALRSIVLPQALPRIVEDYRLVMNANGSADKAILNLDWRSRSTPLAGELDAHISRISDKAYNWFGGLNLHLLNQRELVVRVDGSTDGTSLFVKTLGVTTAAGRTLARGEADVDLNTLALDRVSMDLDSLPVMDIIRCLNPNVLPGIEGYLDGKLTGAADSLVWAGRLTILYPDDVELTGEFQGDFIDRRLHVSQAVISDGEAPLLTVSGDADFLNRQFKKVSIRVEDFPIKRALQIAAPNLDSGFGGALNALVELDGSFSQPMVSGDAHISSGVVRGIPGYWANARCVTTDSAYNLEQFDLGRDVNALLRATGTMARKSGAYHVTAAGSDIDAQTLIETIVGKQKLVSGKGNLNAELRGGDIPRQLIVKADIRNGSLATIEFDRAGLAIRVTDIGGKEPQLMLDSMMVDWGEAHGSASGSAALSGNRECSFMFNAEGRLLELLPRATGFFSQPAGNGSFNAMVGGTLDSPTIRAARLTLNGGSVRFADVIKRMDDVTIDLAVDSAGRFNIRRFTGKVGGRSFRLSNRFPLPGDTTSTIKIGDVDLGILQFSTDENGVWMVIPSLMDRGWGGYISFAGQDGNDVFEFRGPTERPTAVGAIGLHNTTITFPFLSGGGQPSPFVKSLLALLERTRWDARVIPEQNCRYIREVSGLSDIPVLEEVKHRLSSNLFDVDIKIYVDLRLDDETDGLLFTGSLKDTLHVAGDLTSTRGSVEYLDMNFNVDEVGVIFNPADIEPVFYGGASTSVVYPDSIQRTVRMVITDRASMEHANTQKENAGRLQGVPWENMTFVLTDEQGNSQEKILGVLGYSLDNLSQKVPWLSSKLVTNATPLRKWTRALERGVERFLGLDRVDIETPVAGNILQRELYAQSDSTLISRAQYSYLTTLDRSRVTVGKYLTRDLYLSYTGSVMSETAYNVTRLGLVHEWDILLHLSRVTSNLSLDYRFQYSSLAREVQREVFLSYSFLFDLANEWR